MEFTIDEWYEDKVLSIGKNNDADDKNWRGNVPNRSCKGLGQPFIMIWLSFPVTILIFESFCYS